MNYNFDIVELHIIYNNNNNDNEFDLNKNIWDNKTITSFPINNSDVNWVVMNSDVHTVLNKPNVHITNFVVPWTKMINNTQVVSKKDSQQTKKKSKKEITIAELLKLNNVPFIHDQPFLHSKTKRRPDFRINIPTLNDLLLIIEVDEYQHMTYDRNEEVFRMIQIYRDAGKDYVLFIRYNPDNYYTIGENNLLTKQDYTQNQQNRQDYLLIVLNSLIQNRQLCPLYQKIISQQKLGIYVLYLFYDGFLNVSIDNLDLDYLNPFI